MQEGVVILEDLLAEEVADRLNEELLPHFDAPQSGRDVYPTASQEIRSNAGAACTGNGIRESGPIACPTIRRLLPLD